jgi:hypothetical protein
MAGYPHGAVGDNPAIVINTYQYNLDKITSTNFVEIRQVACNHNGQQ